MNAPGFSTSRAAAAFVTAARLADTLSLASKTLAQHKATSLTSRSEPTPFASNEPVGFKVSGLKEIEGDDYCEDGEEGVDSCPPESVQIKEKSGEIVYVQEQESKSAKRVDASQPSTRRERQPDASARIASFRDASRKFPCRAVHLLTLTLLPSSTLAHTRTASLAGTMCI